MEEIKFVKRDKLKEKPNKTAQLDFGNIFTDYMFVMTYNKGIGWHSPEIIPYQPLSLDPAAMCFHYGQLVFEGLKAYRSKDGSINLFRPKDNFKRLNLSNQRLCIPEFDTELALKGLKELVKIEKDWIPEQKDSSLYIRPFIIATQAHLGVEPSSEYKFIIILSPSGSYYKSGLKPVKIYVEDTYVRAVKGGTGSAKTAGNYASSLKAQQTAHDLGYSQVLWLDGVNKKYIEEVGAMNIFFVIKDTIITPELNGSILDGITRKSCIEILKHEGYKVEERKISIDEIVQAYKKGELKEMFGTGTAAVISPICELKYEEEIINIDKNNDYKISMFLYNKITGIQKGIEKDIFSWIENLK